MQTWGSEAESRRDSWSLSSRRPTFTAELNACVSDQGTDVYRWHRDAFHSPKPVRYVCCDADPRDRLLPLLEVVIIVQRKHYWSVLPESISESVKHGIPETTDWRTKAFFAELLCYRRGRGSASIDHRSADSTIAVSRHLRVAMTTRGGRPAGGVTSMHRSGRRGRIRDRRLLPLFSLPSRSCKQVLFLWWTSWKAKTKSIFFLPFVIRKTLFHPFFPSIVRNKHNSCHYSFRGWQYPLANGCGRRLSPSRLWR